MLARHNQENAIYEQQQAAAAKPLNQSVRGLAPKTPANKPPKTPFGKTRNDENANLTFGKGGAKDGKADRNAFITPANPRTRAPLGAKTTNAKAHQTPFLAQEKPKDSDKPSSARPTSPRLRRSKIKVHESTSVQNDILSRDPEEREIEYMPPREVPLPDYPDDIVPHDRTYTQFEGKNLTRGWYSAFAPQRDPEEPDLSDYEEQLRKCEEREKKEQQKAKAIPMGTKSTTSQALRAKPTTLKAQNAASALASKPATKPGASRLTTTAAAAKAKVPASSHATKKQPMFERANPRFTAAKAASNSTIGYSKGRVVSANRRPLNEIHSKQQDNAPAETPRERNTLDDLLRIGTMDVSGDNGDLGFSTSDGDLGGLVDDEEEPEVFQLDPVEEL
ncbi:Hypothetical predicted protein [Lecanosticta acicola]|uniref:Uncharacterized protein n=1 Tax=Lecanosticta acicola TaxID=111012 RepID=A0AAI8YT69_9PEZI|nr:Hypothetical predicted protein [Lecanosticta acicola]